MGFSVPDFGVRCDRSARPEERTLSMTPNKAGDFPFSLRRVLRPSGHENMEGTLRVVA
jgi:heme/copper-type cytochrome/quinol oxidase subunit 2